MNIILFLNRDLHSNFAYQLLKPSLKGHQVHIYLSESVGKKKEKAGALSLLEHYEKKQFYKLPLLLKEQKLHSDFEFFDDQFAYAPLQVCKNVNSDEFITAVRKLKPDLFISIRFGKIFHDEIIKVPGHGILNLHSGILPDYRGILGTLHALREGRKEIGCTLHYINNSSIDTGEIINIIKMPVVIGRSLFWHVNQLYPAGCAAIIRIINQLNQGMEIPTVIQDLKVGNYYSLPDESHFAELMDMGHDVINEKDYSSFITQHISSLIRGYYP
ncbi:MAG: hypothetical protein KDC53_03645 [Saprospiraceae bacterium]|nr:hypothetical protein [Saprospiraceae bacterium]